ncbi:hypothetical protein [Ornithinimicrobium kibberense]|uniref:hypothetical protein n=1 Tax=Ornithinimicrobium kibberense TaxID=282060 RepID=UPI00361BE33F
MPATSVPTQFCIVRPPPSSPRSMQRCGLLRSIASSRRTTGSHRSPGAAVCRKPGPLRSASTPSVGCSNGSSNHARAITTGRSWSDTSSPNSAPCP